MATAFAASIEAVRSIETLARRLGLPAEILDDRMRDIDVALLTARPLRGR